MQILGKISFSVATRKGPKFRLDLSIGFRRRPYNTIAVCD